MVVIKCSCLLLVHPIYRGPVSLSIDGEKIGSEYHSFDGSGEIPFIPWQPNLDLTYLYVYLAWNTGMAYTQGTTASYLLCETPASSEYVCACVCVCLCDVCTNYHSPICIIFILIIMFIVG